MKQKDLISQFLQERRRLETVSTQLQHSEGNARNVEVQVRLIYCSKCQMFLVAIHPHLLRT